jgi:hypothetical protein
MTDSSGFACIRKISAESESLRVRRPGYQTSATVVAGKPGNVVSRALYYHRVPDPCCDLRGNWWISFSLASAAGRGPRPTKRTVAGELALGPRVIPLQQGDDIDSLVHIVRGLHHVDFRPFFGGAVARDVSTSIFGQGPDLLHEVEATVPMDDSVRITFIPRMSHGSLSLVGRIRSDTVRGTWIQNAFCCGANGTFVMARTRSADTAPLPEHSPSATDYARGWRESRTPVRNTPAGQIPSGRWIPELAIAPDGRLWLAVDGLFVADSLFGSWHRVLGGNTDPVAADELRIGLRISFVSGDTVLIGMNQRFPMHNAPVLYRTVDGGGTWTSVALPNVTDVDAISAVGDHVWLAGTRSDRTIALLRSEDAGRTWSEMAAPSIRDIALGLSIHRISDSVAYLYAHTKGDQPSLWRTMDSGLHWEALPAPHEQRLIILDDHDTRIEELATVGSWVLVREHGKVFVSSAEQIRWRPMAGVDRIASEVGGDHVFILSDSLVPALLNQHLERVWQGDHPLVTREPGDVEQIRVHDGVGFVSETQGAVHEVRDGVERVIRDSSEQQDRL